MAIEDVGKIKYSGNVTVIEEQETMDDSGAVFRGIHSEVGRSLGGTIQKTLGALTNISYDASLPTTTSAADIDFSSGDYDGLTGNSATGIDFLFIAILSAASTGTPDCTIEIGGADLMNLIGVGDFCILPLKNYSNAGARLAVYSSGATTVANVVVLIGSL